MHHSLSNQSSGLQCEMLGLAQIDSLIDREKFCVTAAELRIWNWPKEASYTSTTIQT